MSESIERRHFLGMAAAGGLAAGLGVRSARSAAPSETVNVAIVGVGGRGKAHCATFAGLDGVNVTHVCDVDEKHAGEAADIVKKKANKEPKSVTDLRRLLDDKDLDAVVVATCNHWHAPAAILACAAGKHVYVEKPCSHNPHEGELLVAAARKHQRIVQMGNQRRSWPAIIEGIEQLKSGAIGRPYFAHCFYNNSRPSIGKGKPAPVPAGLDYDLWQGPAPRRPFHDNYLHYNWHWFWHWGNGELGNNGVHTLDVARWGLEVDYPAHVSSGGGRYRYQDDQETPDTHLVTFDFDGGRSVTWEGLSCNSYRPGGTREDVIFYGENGSLTITAGGYSILDPKGKVTKTGKGRAGDGDHVGNFLAAIRGTAKPNSEILEGHRSTLLCHLGNIAHRTGRALRCDSRDGRILGDPEAMAFWTREYEKGWEPKV